MAVGFILGLVNGTQTSLDPSVIQPVWNFFSDSFFNRIIPQKMIHTTPEARLVGEKTFVIKHFERSVEFFLNGQLVAVVLMKGKKSGGPVVISGWSVHEVKYATHFDPSMASADHEPKDWVTIHPGQRIIMTPTHCE